LIVPPGLTHVVENIGPGKLYCLTTMMPDEEFAALIRAGIPTALTDEDLRVLGSGLGEPA
jgi:oxalate decarboxylase/phosphoglucose isomerase-like protein (cupin superfamily)